MDFLHMNAAAAVWSYLINYECCPGVFDLAPIRSTSINTVLKLTEGTRAYINIFLSSA